MDKLEIWILHSWIIGSKFWRVDDAMFFSDRIPVCTRLKVTHRVFVLSVRESELHVTAGLACAYTYDNNDSNYAKGQR